MLQDIIVHLNPIEKEEVPGNSKGRRTISTSIRRQKSAEKRQNISTLVNKVSKISMFDVDISTVFYSVSKKN